ncbi:Pseudouridine synthase family protein, partial [Thalictrum thalictroides]
MASENVEERTGVNIDESEAAATAQAAIAEAKECLPPSQVVIDLLSIGVCVRCIFRLFGVRGQASYSCSLLSSSFLYSVIEQQSNVVEDGVAEQKDLNSYDSVQIKLESFCSICLGILQFSYSEGTDVFVKKDQVSEFAAAIAQTVKNEAYEINSFALEISVPAIVVANEHAIRLYMKRKYGSELWFQDKPQNGHISLTEALKFSITNSLESLLGAKYEASSFHIHLTYTHTTVSLGITDSQKSDQDHKRRKTGAENTYYTVASNGRERAENANSEAGAVVDEDSEHFKSPPQKVKEPCCLTRHCYRTPVYIGGRYLK